MSIKISIGTYDKILSYIRDIIAGTEYENNVYAVGGCCRDMLMQNPIKDIDIVVSMPDGGIKFAEWLEENNLLDGHVVKFSSFGTAMFKLKKYPDIELESVQTRNEEYVNRDSRKPATTYGTIKEDCLRRDLTINTIYFNISSGEYMDVCGTSIEDIKNHIIRTPDDPNITYEDDPLRILRCIRFATRFNWKIEENTFKGMIDNIYRLKIVSKERINSEMEKILMDKNSAYGLYLLYKLNAMNYVIPEYWKPNDFNKHIYIKENDPIQYLVDKNLEKCYFFLTRHIKRNVLYNLKFSRDFINYVENLTRLYLKWAEKLAALNDEPEEILIPIVRHLQYDAKTPEMFNAFIDIMSADFLAFKLPIAPLWIFSGIDKNLIDKNISMYDYKLPINGDDIMSLGIPPGKQIREILNKLIELSFENINISKEECENFVKNYIIN